MHAIRRILVAVKDPKSKSHPAVDKAAQLARAFGARLEIFHTITTPLYLETLSGSDLSLVDLENTWRKELKRQLEGLARRASRHGVKVTTEAQWDYPAFEAIMRRAKRVKADLIVVDAHNGTHRAAGLLKLTDWELLRLSPLPILLVKNDTPYKNPVVLAAIDPLHTFAKPSRLDGEILKTGYAFKSALRGTLHAVHGFEPMLANVPTADYSKPNLAESLEARARKLVQAPFDRETNAAKIPTSRRHLIPEHPVHAIPETARNVKSAIVVMGAVSRSGIKRFFIGNTAEQLLDRLTCDVLIVKPTHFKNTVDSVVRGPRFIAAMPITA